MILEREFTVNAPAERVLTELLDVGALASCLPGAELEPVDGSQTFQGRLRPRIGGSPVDCIGTLRPIDLDEDEGSATCSLRVHQVGGPGFAVGTLRGRLARNGAATRVAITAEARVAGVGAPGEVQRAAAELIDDFAAGLERSIAERVSRPEAAAPPPEPAPAAERPAPAPASAPSGLLPERVPAQAAGVGAAALASLLLALVLRRGRRRGAWLEIRYRW